MLTLRAAFEFGGCRRFAPALALFLLTALAGARAAEGSAIEERLRQRVAANPNDAVGWRLLGKTCERNGKLPEALEAFQRSAALDPSSAAAQHDCGRALLALGQPERAATHFVLTVRLAPDSEQGEQARQELQRIKPDWAERVTAETKQTAEIVPVDFEVPWAKTPEPDLPNPDLPTQALIAAETDQRFFFRLESGVLFNSNVELTPISRGLPSSELGSFQAFLSPDIELRTPKFGAWQMGTALSSYFNFNEANRDEFNLEHYQPGIFFERAWKSGDTEWAPRVQYDYAYDAFQGVRFGNKHALTTLIAARNERGRAGMVYWTIDYSDFADDGVDPTLDSLDGWTNTLGMSQTWFIEDSWLSAVRTGIDGQWANLDGADFSYAGFFLFGEVETPLAWESILITKLGAGYRDYYDFTGSPSRNETIWHAGAELRKWLSDHWYCSVTGKYDRFDSENADFESNRYTAGVSVTFER